MRERADRNGVDTASGVRLHIRFRNAAAGLDQNVIPQILAAQPVENRAGLIGGHVVEHQQAGIFFRRIFLQAAKRLGRCACGGFAAHFDLNEGGIGAKRPGFFDRNGCCFFFASSQQREMVVFHHNGVAKPEAVSAAVAEMQCALVEQPQGVLRVPTIRVAGHWRLARSWRQRIAVAMPLIL